jgi:hypothetical protein
MEKVLALVALFAGSVLLSGHATAIPITYTYVGPIFDQPPATAGVTSITSTFTVDLGANLAGDSVVPLSWSISDGLTTIDQSSPDYRFFTDYFFTDASARIVSMLFAVIWFPNTPTHPMVIGTNAAQEFAIGDFDTIAETFYCTGVSAQTGLCSSFARTVSFDPGSLSAASIPEPSTVSLLGAGLIGLLMRRRSTAA